MENEEIIEKVDIIKTSIKELYEAGIIKPNEYNDFWAKINEIKLNIKCNYDE